MIEGELFKNISYMKKPELEKAISKYFKAEEYKGKTIYVPKLKKKINKKLSDLKDRFHAIAPKGGIKTKAKKEEEKKEEKKEEPPKRKRMIIKNKKPKEKLESKKSNAADPAVKAKIDKLRKKGR